MLSRVGAAQRRTTSISDLQKHCSPMELKGTAFDEDDTAKNARGRVKEIPIRQLFACQANSFPIGVIVRQIRLG